MFSLTQNRVYTEKPFLFPTYELFDRFYNGYFSKHPSVKQLDYLEFGLCGRFMRESTWDIDIRLMGSPKESDYEIIADFFRDVTDTGLNKYRLKIDIGCMESPETIEQYNIRFNSNTRYLYMTTYVDYVKQFIRYGDKFYKTTDYSNSCEKIKQVSDNLWRLNWKYDLQKYKRKYLNRVVPKMIRLDTYNYLYHLDTYKELV